MSNTYATPSARVFARCFAKIQPKTGWLSIDDHPILAYRRRKSTRFQGDFMRLYQNEILRNEMGLSA